MTFQDSDRLVRAPKSGRVRARLRSARIALLLVLTLATPVAYGASAVPNLDVVVSARPSGKLAYRGKTDARGRFATMGLAPGAYILEIRSGKPKAWEGSQIWLGVTGGKRLVMEKALPGAMLGGGGIAMIIDVGRPSRISGQIVAGKNMVWLPPQVGSSFPGHWAEEGSPELVSMFNRNGMSLDNVRRIQEKSVGLQ